jgi:HAD superfamily hydrolase (TIGR01549 family)
MKQIRAVSLDVGWTLAYPAESMWEIYARLCGEAGVATTAEDCEQLMRMLMLRGQEQTHARFQRGELFPDSDAEFSGMFVQMSHVIFGQAGLGEHVVELSQRFFDAFWNADTWRAFPDSLDVIRRLRQRGIRVGVLSNAPSSMTRFLERLGILPLLDFVVVSAMEGIKKPDRRIFERTLERAGVAPEEHLHVGDMYLEDILGADAVGIRSLLIDRGPHAMFPSFRESEGRDLAADQVVGDLRDVLARLGV